MTTEKPAVWFVETATGTAKFPTYEEARAFNRANPGSSMDYYYI